MKRELELIRRADAGGVLRPEAIVDYARDQTTELYHHFEWRDSEAAAAYRLVQARAIIRVQVTIVDSGEGETELRAYVSLLPAQGYEETVDVLSTRQGRRKLLMKILDRMAALANSYSLPELRPVVRAIGTLQTTLLAANKRGGRRPPRGRPEGPRPSP